MSGIRRSVAASLSVALLVAACGGAAPTPPPTPTPPTLPSVGPPPATIQPTAEFSSEPADTPSPEDAYAQLLAEIPADIAAICEPMTYTGSLKPDPGQIGEASCDFKGTGTPADYVDYKLFLDKGSMDAFFDTQRKGNENGGTATGPGCGKGPGEGTWDLGRKDCFLFITNDAQVQWTHDQLYIYANAFRDDGDFGKLEDFWKTAGPVAP